MCKRRGCSSTLRRHHTPPRLLLNQRTASPLLNSVGYDEFVFGETSEELCKHLALASKPSKKYGGWKTSRHAKWFGDFQLKQQETQLKEVYERITSELRAASKRRIECEEEIKRLRSEAA
mmetsp:Transcript_3700/g.11404  ORF Transcript_3700/g.11404 Transcript_3700/m.11404 type:complete len:120 (-) Transcript_3700:454-813(-)